MLSGRAWRSFAARGDFAAFDRADHSRLNDPQRHAGLLCGRRSVAAHALSEKEYTFHIDLGIEFLFHSDDPE
jgi:hypothetical protein